MSGILGQCCRLNQRQPCARDRIWTSMRILLGFTVPDLIATADAGMENTKKYLQGLQRAGYVQRRRAKRSGHKGGFAVYHLVRDTGPRAPRLNTDGSTYDPNTNRTYFGGVKQS